MHSKVQTVQSFYDGFGNEISANGEPCINQELTINSSGNFDLPKHLELVSKIGAIDLTRVIALNALQLVQENDPSELEIGTSSSISAHIKTYRSELRKDEIVLFDPNTEEPLDCKNCARKEKDAYSDNFINRAVKVLSEVTHWLKASFRI